MKKITLLAILALLASWGTSLAKVIDTETQPNVIFILADDWGYGDVKILGGDQCKIETPHMDQLAGEGMIFTDAHSSSSVCTPSRYGVLTGRYNWRSTLKEGVLKGFSPALIEKDQQTVAGFMREKGYKTACIGKWHLGMNIPGEGRKYDWKGAIERGPIDVGFDTFYGISASLDMPPYIWIDNDRFVGACTTQKKFGRTGPAHEDFEAVDVLPTITEKSVDYIHAHKDSPFFLYIPLNSPHTPLVPSEEWKGKSRVGLYGDFVMQTDWSIGQIVKAVDDAELAENTLIIVTADNGFSPAGGKRNSSIVISQGENKPIQVDKHYPSKNLRGHKADIYDGGHRVPFIVRWSGQVAAGSVCEQTVSLVDLFATCADLIGKQVGPTEAPDSVSFLPFLQGKLDTPLREATVHHSINGSFAIRKGKWKLAMCPGSGGWSKPKPGRDQVESLPPIQLYDMEADIGEINNLVAEYPEIVSELKALLTETVRNGRSTPGPKLSNTGPKYWEQLNWLEPGDLN